MQFSRSFTIAAEREIKSCCHLKDSPTNGSDRMEICDSGLVGKVATNHFGCCVFAMVTPMMTGAGCFLSSFTVGSHRRMNARLLVRR